MTLQTKHGELVVLIENYLKKKKKKTDSHTLYKLIFGYLLFDINNSYSNHQTTRNYGI